MNVPATEIRHHRQVPFTVISILGRERLTLQLVGELDFACVRLLEECDYAADPTVRHVVVDAGQLQFIDTAGVGALIALRERQRSHGREVRVIRAGARGYITKGSSGGEVSAAVHAVAEGDAVFSPRLAGFVLDAFGAVAGETATATDELDRLSAREQEVMRLIARGYAYKEVAAALFISIKTVETHVSSVLRKLQLSSRHELTAWAMGRRLL